MAIVGKKKLIFIALVQSNCQGALLILSLACLKIPDEPCALTLRRGDDLWFCLPYHITIMPLNHLFIFLFIFLPLNLEM